MYIYHVYYYYYYYYHVYYISCILLVMYMYAHTILYYLHATLSTLTKNNISNNYITDKTVHPIFFLL